MTKALKLLPSLAIALAITAVALAAEKDNRKHNTFEVPTTGRIIDVTYMPEFDEWWVKCREKDGISVYTYDRRSKEWQRARFVAVPPKNENKLEEGEQSPGAQQKSTKAKELDRAEKSSVKPPQAESASKAGAGKPEGETAKHPGKKGEASKHWWDPRNILKLDSSRSPEK
jgi:hypothetical protein